jgi:UDP-N-acetylmuramate--alanine ligase
MEKKIRIAVLLGGTSNEKETSLDSGRNISYKLPQHKYEVIPLFINKKLELYKLNHTLLVHNSTTEIENYLTPELKVLWHDLPTIADFVFIALHGGIGENGAIQGALEMLDMPYNGSSIFASALCMDKYKTNKFLGCKGFAVPRSFLITKEEWLLHPQEQIKKISGLGFPAIVKPHDDGCSVMVQKAENSNELTFALDHIFKQKKHALVEECITGMELTVGVIGNELPRALPPSQTIAAKGILSIEEKFLPGAGENQTPAPLPIETLRMIQKEIELVYKTVHCQGYARIDCFYQTKEQSPTGAERVVILEINSLPGMTPATVIFPQAAELGINPSDFLDMIIELGFQTHAKTGHTKKTIVPEEVILQKVTNQLLQF